MGTSLAITGAFILAGELSKISQDEHPSAAFERYEATFRPFVEKIQKVPFFVPAIVHPATAWKRWIIQTVVWAGVKVINTGCFSFLSSDGGDKEDFVLPEYEKLA